MFYSFAAERKIAFVVIAGGIRHLVEFGDRNINGASSFTTQDAKVAKAIRKHSMSRRGVIVETTPHQDIEPEEEIRKPQPRTLGMVKGVVRNAAVAKPVGRPRKVKKVEPEETPTGEIREYANFTVAKEAICKEFQIPKSKVKTITALTKFAAEKGFSIKYLNAER